MKLIALLLLLLLTSCSGGTSTGMASGGAQIAAPACQSPAGWQDYLQECLSKCEAITGVTYATPQVVWQEATSHHQDGVIYLQVGEHWRHDMCHEIFHYCRYCANQREERWLQEVIALMGQQRLGQPATVQGGVNVANLENNEVLDYPTLLNFAYYLEDAYGVGVLRKLILSTKTGREAVEEVTKERFEIVKERWEHEPNR
jgi:hypothetical protein